MSFLSQPDVLVSLIALAAWCYVWSRGHVARAKQRKWLVADGTVFSCALLSNLAFIGTGEPLFKFLLIVLMSLGGLSLIGRLVVARAYVDANPERGGW